MSMRRLISAVSSIALTAGLVLMVTATPAAAANCAEWGMIQVSKDPDRYEYKCVRYEDGGTTPGDSGGGSSKPPCELKAPYDDLCIGDDACWMNDPAAVQDPKELEGTPKPNEDSYVVYIMCQRPDGSTYDRWYWNDDVPAITIEDRIMSAIGALDLPTIKATFNPPGRTLVNLDTWWWAEGAPAGEIRGSEALGMVAIAKPTGLRITPGDGSAPFTCPMSVTQSDTCVYNYRRAGDYTATVSIVYTLRIEAGGTELDASLIPAEYRTLQVDDDVPVVVREVQTLVTKVR